MQAWLLLKINFQFLWVEQPCAAGLVTRLALCLASTCTQSAFALCMVFDDPSYIGLNCSLRKRVCRLYKCFVSLHRIGQWLLNFNLKCRPYRSGGHMALHSLRQPIGTVCCLPAESLLAWSSVKRRHVLARIVH